MQYAPAVLGVLTAASMKHGFDRKAASAVTGLLRCRYKPYPTIRRNNVTRTVSTTIDLIKTKTNWRSEAVEKLLHNAASVAQKASDFLMQVKNPLWTLHLTESSALDLNVILDLCHLHRPLPFWYALPFWKQVYAEKIAEGSYGEIYHTEDVYSSPRIIKFVAVNGYHPDNMHMNLSFHQALPDIVCSKFLSKLKDGHENASLNFPQVYGVYLLTGSFPSKLTKAWWDFENASNNTDYPHAPRPDRYNEDQLFLMLELEHCGVDMDKRMSLFNTDAVACVVCICQIAAALAVAEAAYEFEHRDLHLGNLMMKPTTEAELDYYIGREHFKVATYGYHFCIIDFTLSRIHVENETFFTTSVPGEPMDLKDIDWLDHNEIYNAQARECNGVWREFHPYTNVLWLKYIIESFYSMLRGNADHASNLESEAQSKAFRFLRGWRQNILQSLSARGFFYTPTVQESLYVSKITET